MSALVVLGVAKVAAAASDFQGNPHNIAPYFYSSEINSMEYDAETDYEANHDNHEDGQDGKSSQQLVSSLTFDGSCFVSAQAIMCNGGGGDPIMYMETYESEEEFSEDEDDDDDDDDGHSSMLSNSSLRRSKALASGPAITTTPKSDQTGHPTNSEVEATYIEGEIRWNRKTETLFASLPITSRLLNNQRQLVFYTPRLFGMPRCRAR